jgi:hypothetical protein
MAEELSLKINIGGKEQVIESVRDLKKAIKEAEFEAFALAEQFGDTDDRVIQLRQQVGNLKNSMADAADQAKAFSEDSKFPAVAQSIQGLASGFTAVQGAMSLVGFEGEAVEKSLLKVQSALAFSEGLGGVISSIDSFKVLSAQIKSTTAFRWLDVQATRAASFVQNLFTGAVNTTSTAFKGLKVAIAATGIGALVVAIGLVVELMMKWGDNTKEVEAATNELNRALDETKRITEDTLRSNDLYTKTQLANAKKRGASEEELLKIEKQGRDERYKTLQTDIETKQKLYDNLKKTGKATYEQVKKAGDELNEAQKSLNQEKENDRLKDLEKEAQQIDAARNKQRDAAKAEREKIKNDNEAAEKERFAREDAAFEVQRQAYLDTLNARNKDLLQAEDDYEEQRKTLLRANITDFTAIEEALRIKKLAINKQYDDEEKKLQDEKDKEEKEKLLKKQAEERQIIFQGLQDKIDVIDSENEKFEDDFQEDVARLEIKKEYVKQQRDNELSDTELSEFEKKQIISKYAKQITDIEKEQTQNKKSEVEARKTAEIDLLNAVSGTIGQLSGLFEKGSAASKVSALSEIAVNTAVGFMQGLNIAQKGANATGPAAPFAFPIFYASQIAAILGAVSKAKSALSQTKGGSGNVPNNTTSAAPITPQLPQVQMTELNQQSINALGNQAIRTYVIESDLTTNQQRIAAIRQRARFS